MSQEKVNWNALTLPKLKDELKRRGFAQNGNKAELVARLEQADADRDAPTVIEEEEEEEVKEVEATEEAPDAEENMEGDAGNEEEKDLEAEGENAEEEEGANGGEGAEAVEGEEAAEGGEEAVAEGEGEEEKAEEEVKETGPTEAEKNAENEKQFFIDMPRERDVMILTWHSKKFLVPFSSEIHTDLAAECSQRSLRVIGLDLADMRSEKFQALVDKSSKFSFDFLERPSSKDTTGSARFVFGSLEEANLVKEELLAYKESLKIEPIKFDYKETEDDLFPIQYKSTAPVPDARPVVPRLLYVGNLPNDVTEAALKELFPDALRVIFPRKGSEENAEKLDQNRFAYLEYATEDDAVKAAEEHKEKLFNDEKLFVIRAMSVRKERYGLLSNTLRSILIDKTRKMKRIVKTPYNKSTFELKEIEKTIASNMDKINKDTVHRESWNMPLGGLDASKIDEEEPKQIGSIVQRGRGGPRGGGRGTRPMRGSYASSMAPRGRGSWGSTPSPQRGGWSAGGNGYNSYGSGRGGAGGYARGGASSGYGGYGTGYNAFPQPFTGGFQSFGGGYAAGGQSYGGKRRAEESPRGGDWKRARGGRGGRGYY